MPGSTWGQLAGISGAATLTDDREQMRAILLARGRSQTFADIHKRLRTLGDVRERSRTTNKTFANNNRSAGIGSDNRRLRAVA